MNKYDTVRPDDEQDVDLADHTLTVEYAYERQRGRWNLVGIDYLCFDCMQQAGVSHPRLHDVDAGTLGTVKVYLLGYLLETPCT